MTFTYTFTDASETLILRTDKNGERTWIPVNPDHPVYVDLVKSGAAISPYVAPPEPKPLTTEEKLANAGLTVEELKQLLA